jgi:hypothetical protein
MMQRLVNKSHHNTTDCLVQVGENKLVYEGEGSQSPPHVHLAQVCKGVIAKTVDADTNECISIRNVPAQEAKSGILKQMKGKQSPLKPCWENISI